MEKNVSTINKTTLVRRLEGKPDGHVYSFDKFQDYFIVFGNFKKWGNHEARHVAVLNKDFTLNYIATDELGDVIAVDISEDEIEGILSFGDYLLVYGDFTRYRHTSVNSVLVVDKNFEVDYKETEKFLSNGIDVNIEKMFVHGKNLFISSSKPPVINGTLEINHVVVLNKDFSLNLKEMEKFVVDGPDDLVQGICSHNNHCIAYGNFEEWGRAEDLNFLALINEDLSLNLKKTESIFWGFDNNVHVCVPYKEGKFLMGGEFTNWGLDDEIYHCAVINEKLILDPPESEIIGYPNQTVYDMYAHGSRIIVVGAFTKWKEKSTRFIKVI